MFFHLDRSGKDSKFLHLKKVCLKEQEELYNQILAEVGVKIEGEMVGAGKESLQAEKVEPQKN